MVCPKQFEERAFFDALSISPPVSTRSISEQVGCGVRAAEKRLKKMEEAGVVRTVAMPDRKIGWIRIDSSEPRQKCAVHRELTGTDKLLHMLDSAISQAAVFDIELRGNVVLNKLHEQLYELNSWAISNKEESFMKQLKEFEIVLNEAYNQCNNYSNELIDDYHARQYFRARVPIPVYHPILPHLERCEPEEPTPTLQTQQVKPTQRERKFSDAVKYYAVNLAHFPDRPTTKSLGDIIDEIDS